MSKALQTLASQIAKREGKRSQARIGDIREILGILSDLLWESQAATPAGTICADLFKAGEKRLKRKKK